MSKKKCCKEVECENVEAVPGNCDGKTVCDKESCVIVLEDSELEGLKEFDKKLIESKCQLADLFMQKRELVENADATLENVANTLKTVRDDYVAAAKILAKAHGVDMDLPNQGNWSLSLSNKTLTKV